MKNCSKTIPTIVEGNSLYEAVCVIKDVAEKAIAEAGTTATTAEEAKAAAAQAQATADQAHEEAVNAQASSEQANEKAQAAQTAADGARQAADGAHEEAINAAASAEQANKKINDIISGDEILPKYFLKPSAGAYALVPSVISSGQQVNYALTSDEKSALGNFSIPFRLANGAINVSTPVDANNATPKSYVDAAVAAAQLGTNISQIGGAVQATESAAAVEQIVVTSTTLSKFANNTNTNLRIINIQGQVASDFSQNSSKKFTFSLENIFPDEKLPASIGLTFFESSYSSTGSRAALCAFSAKSTGEPILTIDFTNIDPDGGHSFEIFGTAIFTFTA